MGKGLGEGWEGGGGGGRKWGRDLEKKQPTHFSLERQ